jgi:hypothetical protein
MNAEQMHGFSELFNKATLNDLAVSNVQQSVLDEFIENMRNVPWYEAVPIYVGSNRPSYVQHLMLGYAELHHKLNLILDRYSSRDDRLISIIEELNDITRTLAKMLQLAQLPELEEVYKNSKFGQIAGFFRHQILCCIQALGVAGYFLNNPNEKFVSIG